MQIVRGQIEAISWAIQYCFGGSVASFRGQRLNQLGWRFVLINFPYLIFLPAF